MVQYNELLSSEFCAIMHNVLTLQITSLDTSTLQHRESNTTLR